MRFVLRIKIIFDTFEFKEELFWKRKSLTLVDRKH